MFQGVSSLSRGGSAPQWVRLDTGHRLRSTTTFIARSYPANLSATLAADRMYFRKILLAKESHCEKSRIIEISKKVGSQVLTITAGTCVELA